MPFGQDQISLNAFGFNPDANQFNRPAPVLSVDQIDAARQAGERYLQSWNEGHFGAMLTQTAPLSPTFAPKLADYKKFFVKRADGGLCPVGEEMPKLAPMTDLTVWEQGFLMTFAQSVNNLIGNRNFGPGAAALPVPYQSAPGNLPI